MDDQASADDAELLAALRGGDERSLEVLVRRHSPALRRLASGVLGDPSLAEDVVQEVWLAALDALPAYEGRGSLRSWLLAICANRARTRLGRERRTVPFTAAWREEREPPETGPFTPAGAWATPVTAWDDTSFDAVSAQDLRRELEAAVAGLSRRQREVVVARDMLGCTSAEVSTLLGVSAGHQRVLLHHARTRLRAELEQTMSGGGQQ